MKDIVFQQNEPTQFLTISMIICTNDH